MDQRFTGFFKSTYSAAGNGDCVEVAAGYGIVSMRDSKDVDRGVITVSHEAFRAFIDSVR